MSTGPDILGVDIADLDAAIDRLSKAALRAIQMAERERELAAWTSRSPGAVSGGGRSDPTGGKAEQGDRYRDFNRIVGMVDHAAAKLEKSLDTVNATLTGKPCKTRHCDGDGLTNHDGYCDRCGPFVRRNGYPPPEKLVADWNRRRPTECACTTECCPDGCLDLVPPGRGTMSDRCYQRQSRARRAS